MDEGDLQGFVERADEALSAAEAPSTGTTELRAVLPLLKFLGWNVHGPEVVADYAVPAAGDPEAGGSDPDRTDPDADREDGQGSGGNDAGADGGGSEGGGPGSDDGGSDDGGGATRDGTGGEDRSDGADPGDGADPADRHRVDYALVVGGDPVAFVATAAAGQGCEAPAAALGGAMAAAGVELGIATDGRSYRFLSRRADDPGEVRATLAELPDRAAVLAQYSRRAVRRRRERRRRERRQRAAEALAGDRERAVEGVAEVLEGAAGTDLDGELPAAAASFVEELLGALSAGDPPRVRQVDDGAGGSTGPDEGTEPAGAATSEDRTGPAGAGESGAATPGAGGADGGASPDGTDRGAGADGAAAGQAGADGGSDGPTADRPAGGNGTAGRAGPGSAPDDPGGSAARANEGATADAAAATGGGSAASGDEGAASGDESAVEAPDAPDGDGTAADEAPTRAETGAGAASAAGGRSNDDTEYVVRFFDHRHSVGAVGHHTAAGAMSQAVEFLVEQHSLDDRLDLPWGPEDADGRAIVSREPVHPNGTRMADAEQISNGYYVYTALPVDATRTVVGALAEKAGLRVMFQGDWEEQ